MLSENLKKAREERGLTQKQVADAVGVTQTAINYFENGLKIPSLPTMISLARTLEKRIDDLID